MFARCPKCHIVHPLNFSFLVHTGGRINCRACKHEFNALQGLIDERSDGEDQAPDSRQVTAPPPLKEAPDGEPTPQNLPTEAEAPIPAPASAPVRQWPWLAALVLLIVFTPVNVAWTWRESLLQNPDIRSFARKAGLLGAARSTAFREPDQVQLISRDIHSHPTRAGILVLSATMVNRASQRQALPVLGVTLTDAGGLPMAQRSFSASEYLPPGADPKTGLESDAYLPVLLEFADPGKAVVGFELSFR